MKRKPSTMAGLPAYRELLQAKRSELLAELGSDIPRLSDLGQLGEDDQAPALHDQFISLEVRQRCYRTIQEIDAALDRLVTGVYGVCLNCGEAINPRRLAAIPWAAHCIPCQESRGHDIEELDERAA